MSPPPGGGGGGHVTSEEADRAANAKKWSDMIEKVRANSPPPPVPQIHFPSKNEQFLRSLCCTVESPRDALGKYLEGMWKAASDVTAQRAAVATFWQEAEKPKWVRPVIEDYYRQKAGQALRQPAEAKVAVEAAPAAKTPSTAPAAAALNPASATENAASDTAAEKVAGDKPAASDKK